MSTAATTAPMRVTRPEGWRLVLVPATQFLHVSGLWYSVGDVIQPGNWGRVVQGNGPSVQNGHPHFYREAVFEAMRVRSAPDRASRMCSVFGLGNMPAASRFHSERGGFLYRVQVDTPAARTHLGSLETFDRLDGRHDLVDVLVDIEQYWTAAPGRYAEILVEAPATVVERYDP